MTSPSPTTFASAQEFLAHALKERQRKNARFSLRAWSRQLGYFQLLREWGPMALIKKLLKALFLKISGVTVFHLTLIRATNHIRWYYRHILEPGAKRYPLPPVAFDYPNASLDETDRLIARSIVTNYQGIRGSRSDASSIWSYNLETHYRPIAEALELGSEEGLSQLLSRMFSASYLYGISSAHLFTKDRNIRWGKKIVTIKLLDDLVTLGEYLGVIPAECPEQGVSAIGLKNGVAPLVRDIEAKLALSFCFPKIGSAYGLNVEGRIITPEMSEHIYVAHRIAGFLEKLNREEPRKKLKIVEIGAGFGGTAYWLHKMLPERIESYTIIDMPIVNVMQTYFLAKALGANRVKILQKGERAHAAINILSCEWVDQLQGPFDLLINENSMPEIPHASVENYLRWARENVQGHFYSYNQEAVTPENEQVYLPGLIREIQGYTLLQRSLSPMRRGYAEEIYALSRT